LDYLKIQYNNFFIKSLISQIKAKDMSAAAPVKKDKHDATYYFKCMIGGSLACGLTHAAICPLDIIKCRMQVNIVITSLFLKL